MHTKAAVGSSSSTAHMCVPVQNEKRLCTADKFCLRLTHYYQKTCMTGVAVKRHRFSQDSIVRPMQILWIYAESLVEDADRDSAAYTGDVRLALIGDPSRLKSLTMFCRLLATTAPMIRLKSTPSSSCSCSTTHI